MGFLENVFPARNSASTALYRGEREGPLEAFVTNFGSPGMPSRRSAFASTAMWVVASPTQAPSTWTLEYCEAPLCPDSLGGVQPKPQKASSKNFRAELDNSQIRY